MKMKRRNNCDRKIYATWLFSTWFRLIISILCINKSTLLSSVMCSSVHNSVHRSNHHPRTSQQPHIPPSLQSKQQPHFHPNTSSHIPDLGKLRASSSIRSRQQHRQSSLGASYEYDIGYSAEKGYKRSHTSSLKASEDKITKRLLKDMGLKKLPDILHVSFGPNCSMSCCPSLYGGYQMSLYAIEQKIKISLALYL